MPGRDGCITASMMKPILASTVRSASALGFPTPFRPPVLQRCYATQHTLGSSGSRGPNTKRRTVTPFNDDGHVPWTELSAGEKTARAAQQTFNFGLVVVGVVLVGGVGYFLYSDVFSPDSKTAYFNRAVDRIKKDHRCLELLGDGKKISAYGEETWNKWRRSRPISSTEKKDPRGNLHLMMHFNVEGPRNKGVVNMHLIRPAGHREYDYKYFFVDIPGHQRIYLENADAASQRKGDGKKATLFGIKWT